MKVKKPLLGIIVPVVTPFDHHEDMNQKAIHTIVNFLIEHGVHGLFPVGSQSEFFALTTDEKKRVMDLVLESAAGRVLVMPNTGAVTTRECIMLSRYAEAAGADAISVVTPFFIKPSQDELYRHYRDVAESVDLPVIAYNNPGRTGVNLLPETVVRLARDVSNFAGIKDSSGDLSQTLEYVRLCPEGFHTFVGRDTLIFPALVAGAVGAVAATANVVPDLVVGIWDAVREGDLERAKRLQKALVPLRLAFSLGSFPVVVKDAMEMLGLPAGKTRRPIRSLEGENREELAAILRQIGAL